MLTDLTIKNIAIIETLQITFRSGLTVLTGETGAGKSIIIDAVGLIMGGRASSDLIRSGEEEATVEAIFDVSALPQVREQLAQPVSTATTSCWSSAPSRAPARTGSTSTAAWAHWPCWAISPARLVNIYGQHESQTLLRPENQLALLDAFAGATVVRDDFAETFRQLAGRTGSLGAP